MGAFGDHHIDFSKAQPSMYAVDLAIPVGDEDIVQGMGIHVGDDGQWYRGCPEGKLPFVTGQGQGPTELDVARADNEMGAGNMGGMALSQGLQFDTTEFVAGLSKRYVMCPSTGANAGKFVEAGDGDEDQIVGWCLAEFSDPDGDAVARIVACVMPSVGLGYSSLTSQSESSQTPETESSRSESTQSPSSQSPSSQSESSSSSST